MRHSLLITVLAGAFVFGASDSALARDKGSPPASIMDQGAFDAADCKTCHEAAVTKMEATKHGTLEQSCASCHDRDKALLHSKDRAEGKETPGPAVKDLKAN
ncbi:MAG: hypothetical protein KBH14_07180, partial [Vicinamibacteria bacterium]|nr:hypothetical protein [Vicinamibacteria bacterium]